MNRAEQAGLPFESPDMDRAPNPFQIDPWPKSDRLGAKQNFQLKQPGMIRFPLLNAATAVLMSHRAEIMQPGPNWGCGCEPFWERLANL